MKKIMLFVIVVIAMGTGFFMLSSLSGSSYVQLSTQPAESIVSSSSSLLYLFNTDSTLTSVNLDSKESRSLGSFIDKDLIAQSSISSDGKYISQTSEGVISIYKPGDKLPSKRINGGGFVWLSENKYLYIEPAGNINNDSALNGTLTAGSVSEAATQPLAPVKASFLTLLSPSKLLILKWNNEDATEADLSLASLKTQDPTASVEQPQILFEGISMGEFQTSNEGFIFAGEDGGLTVIGPSGEIIKTELKSDPPLTSLGSASTMFYLNEELDNQYINSYSIINNQHVRLLALDKKIGDVTSLRIHGKKLVLLTDTGVWLVNSKKLRDALPQ